MPQPKSSAWADRVEKFFRPAEGKLLRYRNRKQDDILLSLKDAQSAEKSIRKVFRILDKDWQVYDDLIPKPEIAAEKESLTVDLEILRIILPQIKSEQIIAGINGMIDGSLSYLSNSNSDEEQIALYAKAKSGDLSAMKDLMYRRRDQGYEEICIETIE